jgi:hypothetical protein
MTAFRMAVWIALALGGFGVGNGFIQKTDGGCHIDPNGLCTKSTGEIAWADEAHATSGGATADRGSGIDPLGGS